MSKILTLFLLIFFTLTSCKKEEETPINPNINWKVGPTVYSGTVVKDSIAGSLYALATNSSFIVNYYDTLISGNYNIVYLPDTLFDLGVTVVTTVNGLTNYYTSSNKNNSVTALVSTDTANRTVVHIPEIWAYNTFNSNDSVMISGTVTK